MTIAPGGLPTTTNDPAARLPELPTTNGPATPLREAPLSELEAKVTDNLPDGMLKCDSARWNGWGAASAGFGSAVKAIATARVPATTGIKGCFVAIEGVLENGAFVPVPFLTIFEVGTAPALF